MSPSGAVGWRQCPPVATGVSGEERREAGGSPGGGRGVSRESPWSFPGGRGGCGAGPAQLSFQAICAPAPLKGPSAVTSRPSLLWSSLHACLPSASCSGPSPPAVLPNTHPANSQRPRRGPRLFRKPCPGAPPSPGRRPASWPAPTEGARQLARLGGCALKERGIRA